MKQQHTQAPQERSAPQWLDVAAFAWHTGVDIAAPPTHVQFELLAEEVGLVELCAGAYTQCVRR
jgi:hypothetical protein